MDRPCPLPPPFASRQAQRSRPAPPAAAQAIGAAEPGRAVFGQYCAACHTAVAGGRAIVGPNLFDIMDRAAASAPGYRNYSAPLLKGAAAGLRWDGVTLRPYLRDPRTALPGTSMMFTGVRDDQRLADLIAYLDTLH